MRLASELPIETRRRGALALALLLLLAAVALSALVWYCVLRSERRPSAATDSNAPARAAVERARQLRAQGHEREAYDSLQQARASGVDLADAEYELASLLLTAHDELLRDPPHAIELLRKWIDSHDKAQPRWNDCAVLLAAALSDFPSYARNQREARQLAEVVRSREPDHPGANALLRRLDGLPDLSAPAPPAQR